VVTTTDAGGPLEVVTDGVTGVVAEARADAVAAAFARLNPSDAATWGRAGRELAKRVTWNTTIERLLAQ
jgi:glycosyltransferase involved in cell wall biosynthesis